jgi:hypothetical protein
METAYSKELKKYSSMTLEEFDKLPFTFVSHWSFSDCNISIDENKEYGILRQKRTKKISGLEFGRITEKFRYDGKWYSKKRLVKDILKDIKPNNQLELF